MAKIEFSARPGLTWELIGNEEVFEDAQTGFKVIGTTDYTSTNPPAFSLRVDNPGGPIPYPLGTVETVLRNFEISFLNPVQPTGMNFNTPLYWSTDKKPFTPGSGGARRNFVSTPFAMTIYDPQNWRSWYVSELSWNLDQLKRPFSHSPFLVTGDQYSKKYVNQNTAAEWNHQWANPTGWNCFDTAHADYSRIAGLVAMGHPLGIINAHLVWRWLKRSAGGTTNWLTQPRGVGWVLSWGVLASYLQLIDNHDADGPKEAKIYLQEWINQAINWPYPPSVGQNAPNFDPDWNGYGPQFSHTLTFHMALMSWGILRVIKSGLIDGPAFAQMKADITQKAVDQLKDIHDLATDSNGSVSYTLGGTHLPTQALADQLAADTTAADGTYTYESVFDPNAGDWRVRRVPQASTSEVYPAVMQAFLGDSYIQSFLNGYRANRFGQFPQYDLVIDSPAVL